MNSVYWDEKKKERSSEIHTQKCLRNSVEIHFLNVRPNAAKAIFVLPNISCESIQILFHPLCCIDDSDWVWPHYAGHIAGREN